MGIVIVNAVVVVCTATLTASKYLFSSSVFAEYLHWCTTLLAVYYKSQNFHRENWVWKCLSHLFPSPAAQSSWAEIWGTLEIWIQQIGLWVEEAGGHGDEAIGSTVGEELRRITERHKYIYVSAAYYPLHIFAASQNKRCAGVTFVLPRKYDWAARWLLVSEIILQRTSLTTAEFVTGCITHNASPSRETLRRLRN